MKCHEFENNIILFYEQELDGSTADRMKKHMQSCEGCAHLYRQVTSAYTAFDKPAEVPALDVDAFYEGVAMKAGLAETQPIVRLLHRMARVAAAVIFLAGVSAGIITGSLVLQSGNNAGSEQDDYYKSLASDFHLSTAQEYSFEDYLAEDEEE